MLQEVLVWLTQVQRELGDSVSDEKLRDFVWNTLQSGKVTLFCFVENENLTWILIKEPIVFPYTLEVVKHVLQSFMFSDLKTCSYIRNQREDEAYKKNKKWIVLHERTLIYVHQTW